MPLKNRKKSFTITEVMMAAIIASLAIGGTIAVYISCQRNFQIGGAYLDIHANARLALDRMAKDVRWARRIIKTHLSYSTADACLIAEVPSIDAGKEIIDGKYDYVIYRLQGKNIERIVDADPASSRQDNTSVAARECQSLYFSSGGTALSAFSTSALEGRPNIAIKVVTSKAVGSLAGTAARTLSDDLRTLVKLRNKE